MGSLSSAQGSDVLTLLMRAFDDNVHAANTQTAFVGYRSPYPNLVRVLNGDELVGVALVAKRNIGMGGSRFDALTVGPLAIDPGYQGRGLSIYLMEGIDGLAAKLGASLIYLVGTPGFYGQYEYFPVLSRSKLVVQTESIPTHSGVYVRPYCEEDLPALKDIFRHNSEMHSCSSRRSDGDWEWLTKHARDTYYFNNPQVVLRGRTVVGYFCADARDPRRIREALPGFGSEDARHFLSGLRQCVRDPGSTVLEIMTPSESVLHKLVRKGQDCTYTELIQRNAGQLMKIADAEEVFKQVSGEPGDSPGRPAPITLTWAEERERQRARYEGIGELPSEQLPGLLSGYLQVEGHHNHLYSPELSSLLGELSQQSPFVYQGDNL